MGAAALGLHQQDACLLCLLCWNCTGVNGKSKVRAQGQSKPARPGQEGTRQGRLLTGPVNLDVSASA